jgi:hypothetical protein
LVCKDIIRENAGSILRETGGSRLNSHVCRPTHSTDYIAHLRRQVTFTSIPQDSPKFHVHVAEVMKKKEKKKKRILGNSL